MPIAYDKKKKRYRYFFNRVIESVRYRYSRILPAEWSQKQVDEFDRQQSAKIYAEATGVRNRDPGIAGAVIRYLEDKRALKSHSSATEHLKAIVPWYQDKPMSKLPEIARSIAGHTEWAPATRRNRLALLKAACRWAWKTHGYTDADPTARMQLPSVKNERHVYASRQQMLSLARHADHRGLRRMILVAFYTGMRLSEILSAKPVGDTLVLDDTKNGQRRVVPAHPKIKHLLKHLPLADKKSTLQRAFQRCRAAAHLEHIHIHDLRHSAASEMINNGVDVFLVGAILGHKDSRSTRRYTHLQTNTLAAAVATIGKKRKPGKT